MNKSIIAALSILMSTQSQATQSLNISSIDWCPQLCNSGDKAGYVLDTVREVFRDSPYEIDTKIYPWTRAIKNVESGKSHALLSPAKQEAPQLRFPIQEIGLQRMCFFAKSSSDWTYDGLPSLKGIKVGIASDTSIEELDNYIGNNPDDFDSMPYSDNYLARSVRKLDKNRIDVFVFTYNSTMYNLNKMGVSDKYKNVGCVNSAKIYMAFTPATGESENVDKMISYFDSRMSDLKKSGKISEIMEKYGLDDWQKHL